MHRSTVAFLIRTVGWAAVAIGASLAAGGTWKEALAAGLAAVVGNMHSGLSAPPVTQQPCPPSAGAQGAAPLSPSAEKPA